MGWFLCIFKTVSEHNFGESFYDSQGADMLLYHDFVRTFSEENKQKEGIVWKTRELEVEISE